MDTLGTLFLPPKASTTAGDVDALFNFMLGISIFFFVLIMGLVVFFVIRYRRRGEALKLTPGITHNNLLEITWIIIPVILVGIIFVWGFKGYIRSSVIPKDAMEIKVTGQKWFWSFTYPEGNNTINELVVPSGTPIKLLMSSQDVIHSFFVPDFRIKRDVLPNRYTLAWFEAPREGNHHLFCAEYCGTDHSKMIGTVRVVSQREYNEWIEEQAFSGEGMTPEEYGAKLYVSKTCNTCHSIDGSAGNGPSFLGLFGHEQELQSGEVITVDENYIRESILNPQS
ncbi:MAG: cytochrome c oxidase subunit II, partial [candidate division Zixibacteria bacterium]|nr:cytochrome c oxidase subunit II [candidate division Zixibacteria bacterium]